MLLKKVIVPSFDFYLSARLIDMIQTVRLLQDSCFTPSAEAAGNVTRLSMGPCGARHAPEIL